MLRVTLPVFDHVLPSSILGTIDTLHVANSIVSSQQGGRELFEWRTLSASVEPNRTSSGMRLTGDVRYDEATFDEDDILVMSALHYESDVDFFRRLDAAQPEIRLVKRAFESGATICGVCTGTFFLGDAAVLDGRRVTTSWWMEPQFRTRFPEARLDADAAITIDDRIWCAGAITSNYSITLKLIERHAGIALSQTVAKVMLLDPGQRSQLPYRIQNPNRVKELHTVAKNAFTWMQLNTHRALDVEELAREVGTSVRSLNRHLNEGFRRSPKALFNEMRIDVAKQHLETTNLNVDEIRGKIGYDDASAFRRSFKRVTGMSPSAYRARFSPRSF